MSKYFVYSSPLMQDLAGKQYPASIKNMTPDSDNSIELISFD